MRILGDLAFNYAALPEPCMANDDGRSRACRIYATLSFGRRFATPLIGSRIRYRVKVESEDRHLVAMHSLARVIRVARDDDSITALATSRRDFNVHRMSFARARGQRICMDFL